MLALTTNRHSAELPTSLPQPLLELLQVFFFWFCILRPLNTIDATYQSSRMPIFDHAGDFNSAEAL